MPTIKEPLKWLTAVEDIFQEAVQSGDFKTAQAIIADTRDYGFAVEADYLQGIMERAKSQQTV